MNEINISEIEINQFRSVQTIKEMSTKISSIEEIVLSLSAPAHHIVMSNKELAEYLKVSTRTLQKWRDNGTIKFSKIGREIFYTLSDVLDMLEKHSIKPFK